MNLRHKFVALFLILKLQAEVLISLFVVPETNWLPMWTQQKLKESTNLGPSDNVPVSSHPQKTDLFHIFCAELNDLRFTDTIQVSTKAMDLSIC